VEIKKLNFKKEETSGTVRGATILNSWGVRGQESGTNNHRRTRPGIPMGAPAQQSGPIAAELWDVSGSPEPFLTL